VVAEDLAEHFVDHRGVGLAHHRVAELPLDRAEGRFRVAPLVVLRQVLFPVELKEVERLLEQPADPAGRVLLERDERLPAALGDPPHSATASKFSRDRYALSALTSPTSNPFRVSLTSGTNCGQSAASLSRIRTAVTTFVLTPQAMCVLTHAHLSRVMPYLWS